MATASVIPYQRTASGPIAKATGLMSMTNGTMVLPVAVRAAFAVAREDDQGNGVDNEQTHRQGGRRGPRDAGDQERDQHRHDRDQRNGPVAIRLGPRAFSSPGTRSMRPR